MNWCLRKYFFDIFIILIFSPFIFSVLTLVAFFLMLFEGRPIIFKSQRVGVNQKLFTIYKFRTMVVGAPVIETDMMDNQSTYITKLGRFLRMTSLDELPQIFNVIIGQMSLVGPRPALQSQHDLNKSRLDLGISLHKPGITGLAQIKGRDTLSLNDKLSYDRLYCCKQSLRYDVSIIISSIIKVLRRSNISH